MRALFCKMSRLMTKPTKWPLRRAKTRISLGICPLWSESLQFPWRNIGPLTTYWAHSEDWSDWTDAQADLSLRWAHMSFCWFCRAAAQILKTDHTEKCQLQLLMKLNKGAYLNCLKFTSCFDFQFHFQYCISIKSGERGGSVVECRTPEREVRGSRPTAAVLCPWARHFTPRKYWLITQEAMAPSRYDWKIVDWDVKPQHNQPNL